MQKEINEKTFELNITNELLNISKSFIWYLDYSPLCHLLPRNIWTQFLNQSAFFAEGLTQQQEKKNGYDVSINCMLPDGHERRLMFLQYKAGIRKKHSYKTKSKFYIQTAAKDKKGSEHILFTFNDAAKGTQHSTLRNLANQTKIQSQSVMYVFPRITEKNVFINTIGNLIYNSSFVPVLDIDSQAFSQTPSISIDNGITHKYRTSYNGSISEVNYFFFPFEYDNSFISKLLSELICIQIERFSKILIKQDRHIGGLLLSKFINNISNAITRFVENELKQLQSKKILIENVNSFIKKIGNFKEIPKAPSEFTTIIPKEGLKLKFKDKNDFSSINYQIF